MNNHFDVIVIGLGAMGSSACYHLALRKQRVLGLEQFDIPHARGSSHGFSRMIRLAYYEHPDYVPLLRRAYQLWDELEAVSGQRLVYKTGGIYMGPLEGEVVSGALAAAHRHGLEHELLDRVQLHHRYPQFQLPEGTVGVFEPEAGFLLPERVIATHAELALRAGAELHGHEPVLEWDVHSSAAIVRTQRGEYTANRLLFCGGAWSGRLLRDLGVKLNVTRQPLGWFWPKAPDQFQLGVLPVWGIEQPDHSLAYGFPMMQDSPGVKIARHAPGKPADPDRIVRDPVEGDEAEIRSIISSYLPAADGPLLSLRICMYTNSPDSHFIIDQHPRHSRILLACGFSGHGFKFASVIGEILADLAAGGTTAHPVEFLRLNRFATQG